MTILCILIFDRYQYIVPSGQGKRSGLWVTDMLSLRDIEKGKSMSMTARWEEELWEIRDHDISDYLGEVIWVIEGY